MNKGQRWSAIIELLAERQQITVRETAERFGISTATIRRDFDELAAEHLLQRSRGGAIANGVAYTLPIRYRAGTHADEKLRIAAAAADLVGAGTVIGLNGGTTTTAVAQALVTRPGPAPSNGRPSMTVVTNTLNIAMDLVVRPNIKVVVAGGVCRSQSYELIGPFAAGVFDQLSLDIAFLGVDALDAALGASSHDEDEAATNRLMASRASQVVVVADASKLGRRSLSRICRTEEISELITDSSAASEVVESLRDAGVRVTVV